VYPNERRLTQKATEINGRPPSVTRLKILGAWPWMERPNKIREEEYRTLLPAEKALVKAAALMMCGRTFIPARLTAMTYGLREEGSGPTLETEANGKFTSERRHQFRATSTGCCGGRAYRS
jgi:hypothetical protein